MDLKILQGLRVLDFSRVLAGPFATRILADFGAEVIKVQSEKTSGGAENNTAAYFAAWNRNKKSVTLDMGFQESRDLALKLIAISDVVVENFSPRVMTNWGLSYEKLVGVNADLIMLSMSGMGQTGPWKNHVALGPTVQALGGLTYLTSYEDGPPVGSGYAYADPVSGLYGALAVLAALEHRTRTGEGRYIDLSEYEAVCSLIGPSLMEASARNEDVPPAGNCPDHVTAAPYGCYPCLGEDRWCVIAVSDQREWNGFCEVAGKPGWTEDDRFLSQSERRKNRKELDQLVARWTGRYPPERIVAMLQESGVPAGVVQSAEDLANDPHLQARDFFVQLHHKTLGNTISDRSPIRFSRQEPSEWKASPLPGEDNEYVFMDLLGLSEAEFRAYLEKGVIR